jgi:hypothetical protein
VRPHLSLSVSLLLLCSCHHATKPADGSSPPGGPSVSTGPGPVTGTAIDVYLTDSGELQTPYDPQGNRIAALVPSSTGTFTVLLGTLTADGSFTIPVVPAGPYYLRVDTDDGHGGSLWGTYVVTSERTLAVGAILGGRPNLDYASMPTPLTVDADGLSPWQPDDDVQLFSLGADSRDSLSYSMIGSLKQGDLRVTADFQVMSGPLALIDGSKGDRLTVSNLVSATAGTLKYRATRGAFEASPFTQRDGEHATVVGTFAPVPQRTISLTWNQAAFAALASDVHAGSAAAEHDLEIYAEPAGPGRASWGYRPTLLTASSTANETRDQRVDLSFGDPFPAGWPVGVQVSTWYGHPDARAYSVRIGSRGPLEVMARNPLGTPITPPRSLRLEGPRLAPRISWDPPAIGQPAVYVVSVVRKDDMDSWDLPVDLYTQGRSVTLPPEILQAARPYFVIVEARTAYDPKAPLHEPAELSYAQAVSDVISP